MATALLAAVEREERVIIFEIEYLKKLKEAVDSKEIKSFERRIRRVGRLENKLRRYHKQIKKAIKKLSEKNFRIARNTTGNKTTSAIKNILKLKKLEQEAEILLNKTLVIVGDKMVALARGGETFYRNYWELAEQVILELDEDLKGWIVIDNILRKAGEEVTVKPAKEDISIRIKNLFFGEGEFSGYSRKERKKLIEKWVERGKKVEISDMEINAEKSREIWFYNFKNITFKDIVMKDAQVLGNKSVNNEFINIKMKSSRLEFTDLVTNTHFKNIKMTGESEFSILPSWHLEESEIINRKNLFEDIDFGGCKVKIDTENSIFKNVDFSNANIDVSGFKKCKFIGCSFRNAKITTFVGGPVFRKCIFINKNVEESFKGIKNMDTDLRKDGEETKKMIKKGSKKALFKECEFRERA